MSCEDCDNEPLRGAYLRLGAANIEIVACRKHWLEARDLLLRCTPDLTEALARLKALEEEMKAPVFVGTPSVEVFGVRTVVMPHLAKWVDEIAAIRGKLGGE